MNNNAMRIIAEAERLLCAPKHMVLSAMYPADNPRDAEQMAAKQHKCALFARAVLRGAGYSHPHLELPYVNRFRSGVAKDLIPSDAVQFLREVEGWSGFKPGVVWPGWQPGFIYIIQTPGKPSSLHVLVAVRVSNETGQLKSIDGGYGSSYVRSMTRTMVNTTGIPALYDPTMGCRPVIGWIDPVRLVLDREVDRGA